MWATRTESAENSRNRGRTSSIGGWPTSIAALMPVMSVILAGTGCRGSTSCEKVATWRPPSSAHGADLGDLGEAGRAAGGLEVDDGEGDGRQVAAAGAPLLEAHVERPVPDEPLVVAHDVGDEGAHELGRAVGHGEEAGPDLAVIEGFAGLLEKSDQLIDRRER